MAVASWALRPAAPATIPLATREPAGGARWGYGTDRGHGCAIIEARYVESPPPAESSADAPAIAAGAAAARRATLAQADRSGAPRANGTPRANSTPRAETASRACCHSHTDGRPALDRGRAGVRFRSPDHRRCAGDN